MDNGGLDFGPIMETIASMIGPILQVLAFAVAIVTSIYLIVFWIGYWTADDDVKEEKMAKWKVQWKYFIITIALSSSIGTIITVLGSVLGLSISI